MRTHLTLSRRPELGARSVIKIGDVTLTVLKVYDLSARGSYGTCMLNLSNSPDVNWVVEGESLTISPGVSVLVKEISGKQVRLAFTAPKDVVILRGELTAKRNGMALGRAA